MASSGRPLLALPLQGPPGLDRDDHAVLGDSSDARMHRVAGPPATPRAGQGALAGGAGLRGGLTGLRVERDERRRQALVRPAPRQRGSRSLRLRSQPRPESDNQRIREPGRDPPTPGELPWGKMTQGRRAFVLPTRGAIRLWRRMGFAIVGTLPGAFRHPNLGFVDAFVMSKRLSPNPSTTG